MVRIFVCSPLRGDTQADQDHNRIVAIKWCRMIALAGNMPLVPHVYAPQFLRDEVDRERALGIGIGLEFLRMAHAIIVDGRCGVTSGMANEIRAALTLMIPRTWILTDQDVEKMGFLIDLPRPAIKNVTPVEIFKAEAKIEGE